MNKKQEFEIVINFKSNKHQNISIIDLSLRSAKKFYKRLIYQWKHYKAVEIPLYALTVAADTIFYISIRNT
jgi:hypothetical protein